MPAITNVVVADATPTNQTLIPQSASMALSTWQQTTAAIYDGNIRLSMVMSPPNGSRKTTRCKHTLTVPIVANVDGVDKVVDTMIYTIETVVPASVSAANALHGWTLLKNLAAHPIMQAYTATREPAY